MVTTMLESRITRAPASTDAPRRAHPAAGPQLSAWDALVERRDDAYLLALRLAGNGPDAEDIVQDAYVRALKFVRQIPGGIDGWYWFQRVIINAARDYRTSEQRRAAREQAAAAQSLPAQKAETHEQDRLRDAVADAMLTLEADVRTILCLHYEQNLPYVRAAELLGANEGSLRAAASRGIQLLRNKLARSGFPVAAPVVIGTLSGGLRIKAPATVLAAVHALSISPAPAAIAAAKLFSPIGVKTAFMLVLLTTIAALVGRSPSVHVQPSITAAAAVSPFPQVTRGDGQPAPAGVESDLPEAESISPELAAILARKVSVSYRRDFLDEILGDLKQITGLRSVYPNPISRSFLFTFEARNVTVESVLRRLAKMGGLKVEFHADTVVFWRESSWLDLVGLQIQAATGSKEDKRNALHSVAMLADKRIYPVLFTLANDGDPLISEEALANLSVHHLREFRYGAGVRTFVSALLKRLDANSVAMNRPLMNVICATKDPRVGAALIALVKANPQMRTQVHVVDGNDPEKAELSRLFDPAADVRETACSMLGSNGGSRYFKSIRKLLDDPEPNVRNTAISTLVQLAADPAVRAWLLQQIKNPPPGKELLFAYAFTEIREPAAVPDLLKLLKRDDAQLQQQVALALGHSRDPRAIEPLFALLAGPDQSVAHQAAWALGMTRDDDLIPRLNTRLADANPQVRANAALALSTLRTPGVLDALIALQKDKSPIVRSRLAEALLQVFDERTLSVLDQLLHDPDPNVRAETAMEIGRGGDTSTELIDSIVGLVGDADSHVRACAIIGLAQVMTPAAVDAVIKALDDKDETVRATADTVLTQCHAYLPGIDEALKKARAAHPKSAPKPPAPPSSEF